MNQLISFLPGEQDIASTALSDEGTEHCLRDAHHPALRLVPALWRTHGQLRYPHFPAEYTKRTSLIPYPNLVGLCL